MATTTIQGDYFQLEWLNTTVSPYAKNGNVKIGRYHRDAVNLYVSECLVECDVSSIPSGSTINSVTCNATIVSTTLSGAPDQTLVIQEQDNGSWTDNGTTQPVYNLPNPPFDTAHVFTNTLSSVGGINNSSTGTLTIPTSSGFVALIQDFVDGTKNAADGVILDMHTFYFNWYITVNNITITVDYTPPVTGSDVAVDAVTTELSTTEVLVDAVNTETDVQQVIIFGITAELNYSTGSAQIINIKR